MSPLLGWLSSAGDLLLVILGFSLIIVVHELGHFLAARWARIRVLAFAVGFGPALLSYRKGLGWRRGSSESEVAQIRKTWVEGIAKVDPNAISPTEYRLNALPFGGYVKMLGQEDLDPTARSSEPDSYQSVKPWKRMIVISAGVICNLITAALLFILVFSLGLKTEAPKVGHVEAGSPAARAVAAGAASLGITEPGLQPGDEILSVDGEQVPSFNDVALQFAMARKGTPLSVDVRRPGIEAVLRFSITPEQDPQSKLLSVGITPAVSTRVYPFRPSSREQVESLLARRGVRGLEPGMRLQSVNGVPVTTPYALTDAADRSEGRPLTAVFTDHAGSATTIDIPVRPTLMREQFAIEPAATFSAAHLLGLMPVLAVEEVVPKSSADKAGLRPGDVFTRVGSVEWPSVPSGVAEIRASRGRTVRIVVARADERGRWTETDLGEVKVSADGTIGFGSGDSSALGPWVGTAYPKDAGAFNPPRLAPGSRILAVNGRATATLLDVREALRQASIGAAPGAATVTLSVQSPLVAPDGAARAEEVPWLLSDAARATLAKDPWNPALDPDQIAIFEPEQVVLKARNPAAAIGMGLHETHRVMMTTYITFARLAQGSLKVQHLKGPIGIAHAGTMLAGRGFTWLLFFMALISVNLAVINFLPLPIVDGGHFLFLLYEQFTGRPVSAAIQNAATVAGLIVIATIFLVVTFHDITNLFKG